MAGRRAFTEDEVHRIMGAMDGRNALRDQALLITGINTGFRACELLSMRLGDVVQGGRIVDRFTIARRYLKGARAQEAPEPEPEMPADPESALARRLIDEMERRGLAPARRRSTRKNKIRSRTMILNPTAQHHLRLWIDELRRWGYFNRDTFLWQSRRGSNRPISIFQFWRIIEFACIKARVYGAVGTHSLRKTFVNRISPLLGGDMHLIQESLGHASITSTESYVDRQQEEVFAAVARM